MDRLDFDTCPPFRLSGLSFLRLQPLHALDGKRFVTWWHGGLMRGRHDPSQPETAVLMREVVDEAGTLGDFHCVRVAATSLGVMRIGSLWAFRGGGEAQLEGQARYRVKTFDVDFSPGGWRFCGLRDEYGIYLFPKHAYPVFAGCPNWMADSRLVQFDLSSGKSLFVPCLELFTRTYGASAEVRRILLTYHWDEAEDRLFCPSIGDLPSDPGTWPVCVGRSLHADDAVFLAHVRHDPHVLKLAKKINAALQAKWGDGSGREQIFIDIAPWFNGTGRLKVAGIDISERNAFLALNILGMSLRNCTPVVRYVAEGGEVVGNLTEDGGVKTTLGEPPGSVALDQVEPPDAGCATVRMREPGFEWLEPPPVSVASLKDGRTRGGLRKIPGGAETVSGGDPHGERKGVDKGLSRAPALSRNHGILWGMWEAFRLLAKKHPGTILDVGSYTSGKEDAEDSTPRLIPFPRPKKGNHGASWVFAERKVRRRGLLVIRVRTIAGTVFVIEIERRMSENEEGQLEEKEKFCGLVWMPGGTDTLKKGLRRMLRELPARRGVFKKDWLESGFLRGARKFVHSCGGKDATAYESTARRALAMVGVDLKGEGKA